MTPEERQLLSNLTDRIKNTPVQHRDDEADQFLRQLAREYPDTTYVLAQTVIMQDFAMRNAQAQIEDLRQQLSERDSPQQRSSSGSFLGGLFGGGGSQQAAPPQQPSGSVPRVNPWAQPQPPQTYAPPPPGYGGPGAPPMQPSQTGGFLRNAAATAAGVAGGAFLFQGLSSMFSGHEGGLGGLAGASVPRDSVTETTVNNYYDDKNSDRDSDTQSASYDDDGSDNDDGGDFGDDSDFA